MYEIFITPALKFFLLLLSILWSNINFTMYFYFIVFIACALWKLFNFDFSIHVNRLGLTTLLQNIKLWIWLCRLNVCKCQFIAFLMWHHRHVYFPSLTNYDIIWIYWSGLGTINKIYDVDILVKILLLKKNMI